MKKNGWMMGLFLFALLVFSRLVSHPHNFTALSAVALFAGSLWPKGYWRFAVPLAAMMTVDFYLGAYPGFWVTYIAVILSVLIAPQIQASVWKIAARAGLSAVVFFIFSNLGVYIFSGIYELSYFGLVDCYVQALPFFRPTLLSAWVYSFALYGGYRLLFEESGFQGFVKFTYGRQK